MKTAFDEHNSIVYNDLEKLYWNIYPFRVKVFHEMSNPKDRYIGLDQTLYDEWKAAKLAHLKFFYRRKAHCPQDTSAFKAMDNGLHAKTFSFFFKNEADAKHFINKNKRYISEVERPPCPQAVDELSKLSKRPKRQIVLRDILFWNKYRYCIEFKEQDLVSEQLLDERVLEFFNNKSNNRYYYTYSKRRRLYLTDDKDLLAVYMALHEKFRMETHVILKKDIKNDER